VSWYRKGKTNLDFTEARDISWPMQVCTSLQTDNHASVLQTGCPSCTPTNSFKALKAARKGTQAVNFNGSVVEQAKKENQLRSFHWKIFI